MFNAKHCSLDVDVRNNLPAMLQPPVGLIWLDEFPNHGLDPIVQQNKVLGHGEPLLILEELNILKVKPGVSKNARHLAAQQGIANPAHVDCHSGVHNLERELPPQDCD